jgi:hypothetical protein
VNRGRTIVACVRAPGMSRGPKHDGCAVSTVVDGEDEARASVEGGPKAAERTPSTWAAIQSTAVRTPSSTASRAAERGARHVDEHDTRSTRGAGALHEHAQARSHAGMYDRQLLARLSGSRSPYGMQHGSERRLLGRLLGPATMNTPPRSCGIVQAKRGEDAVETSIEKGSSELRKARTWERLRTNVCGHQ